MRVPPNGEVAWRLPEGEKNALAWTNLERIRFGSA